MSDYPALYELGSRLRTERIKRLDSQAKFAARIGVSVPTLRKMEAGDPAARIGHWVTAIMLLDRESDLDNLLTPKEDLFEKYEKMTAPQRKRAPRSGK